MDKKSDIKAMNQGCENTFEKHVRSLDLHDTTLKNIEIQAVQPRNQAAFQNEK